VQWHTKVGGMKAGGDRMIEPTKLMPKIQLNQSKCVGLEEENNISSIFKSVFSAFYPAIFYFQ
jgi:hypothetical protein